MAEGPVDSVVRGRRRGGAPAARRAVASLPGRLDRLDREAWMVVSGGVLGAMFASMGLAVLFGPANGFGGAGLAVMGVVSVLGLMPCGAGLVWALIHPRRGLPSVALGTALGLGAFTCFAGDGLNDAWKAPPDRPATARAVGSWTSGDLVVRVRPDEVVAYRGSNGTVAWRWAPPGLDTVCAMSRGVGPGRIGLIGHSPNGRPCAGVTALGLADGEPTWTATVDAPARDGDSASPDQLAVAGDEAVLQGRTDWRAVRLSDGHDLWRAAADTGCTPFQVAGGTDGVVTVAQCGAGALPVLRSLAARDGRERARIDLPAEGGIRNLAVVSVEPLAVWVDDQAQGGTHAVLSYGGDGRQRAAIPVSGDEYDLDVMLGGVHAFDEFSARPLFGGVVVGDLYIAPGGKPGDVRISGGKRPTRVATGRLVAYSLVDGRRRWTAGLDDQVTGVLLDGDSVWALTRNRLTRIEAATGRLTRELDVNGTASLYPVDLALAGTERFTVVAEDGTRDEPPVRGLD
ncbi:PQQ-binding-like beta-propeller repeat protein [Kitasatospora sp. NPDC101183]|uniref:outer membrane protein assembly factor BamB family protein n=1 Tax=Kitasatospora sp. NPDC101183 TaxID=3364100 RepID=UPI003810EDC7